MEKWYNIAGLVVKMDTRDRVEHLSIPYEISPMDKADVEIYPDREAVRKKAPNLAEIYVEAFATYTVFFSELTKFDGLLMHSSAIISDGKAYLFTANSGTGKSTHTMLWRKVFGDERVRILNDDKPAVRLEDGVWYAYGTPWSGKSDLNLNLKVPLGGICLLRRGEENSIRRLAGREAVTELFRQTARPKTPEVRVKTLELLDKLLAEVPMWEMHCNMKREAAIMSYEAMSGKKWEGK